MVKPATNRPRISDPDFRHAVALIDAGNVSQVTGWVDAKPNLLRDSADEDGSFAGHYFAHPRLIWFVAENPIRNGTLPANICEVTQALIDLSRQHAVPDLSEQLNYTLALVGSGMVARQCGVQRGLIKTLTGAGGDPNSIVDAALAHREIEACEAALECGADLNLSLAAGLGRVDDLSTIIAAASEDQLQQGLAIAAINGQAECADMLLRNGARPNEYNPQGMHAHCTPLHQAVYADSVETVKVLLSHGADPSIKDTIFHCDSIAWAEHEGHRSILKVLQAPGAS